MELGRIPIIMCGDFNGSRQGHVANFLQSQGFVSTYHACNDSAEVGNWVSHLSHRGERVGVDYIWLLNPDKQRQPLTCDWRRSVMAMIAVKLVERGLTSRDEAFRFFDRDQDCMLSPQDMQEALEELGMAGPRIIGLAAEEIDEIHNQIDADRNGLIDSNEFESIVMSQDIAVRPVAIGASFLAVPPGFC